MEWCLKGYSDLTNEELYELMKARVDIFVVEQECAYPELDDYDQQSMHCFLKINEQIAAYVRILPANTKYKEVSIGRVLVVKEFRGKGYATQIMQKAIDYINNEWQERKIKIQAQAHLENFYNQLGFKKISEVYLDDNIPHIDMIWEG
ncbi:GNAT family N-acetyltransferase [Virgibacillus halodenitrificans]|uniref:GNAT family N-acetyltransferase n=1 Tax=Virgibacillus halodenitrificans TaxID=1482 RepID=A0AAC9IXM2_VIRHA|nr:GNAT family N-acetyltransferase [Virgibacillus halodenitrificans]APC47067.1 GNAT family N-acetyltransferase [Virgibacillus halodenitrificans]